MTALVDSTTNATPATRLDHEGTGPGAPPPPGDEHRAPVPDDKRQEAGAATSEVQALLIARSRALAERVKELKCLQSLSSMVRSSHSDLHDILQKMVNVLPSALQHPGLGCASIKLKNRQYQTHGAGEPRWFQEAGIPVGGETVGTLLIGYTAPLADGSVPELLPEEQALLNIVAHRIGDIVAIKEAQAQLSTNEEQLRSLASELSLAEERERRRLALLLHDRIGQGLAVAKLKIETLKSLLPAEHHPRLEDISMLIKEIVQDTRSLTFEISPPILYELGLQQAIIWLGESVKRQYGLQVDVCCDEKVRDLTEGLRVMLFRAIQELLTNTVKHACATRATVSLRDDAGGVSVTVEDDGVGFEPDACTRYPSAASGYGLFSIRERIGHVGGRMQVESGKDAGTRIRLFVPAASSAEENGKGATGENPAR
ncbi:MAG TPA: sensor histidine kinase [Thermoanaerobaculales bacterium]|nr:sensor histidine kinase [Thermoanaerobaculales bacterium]HPA79680.1 sensor histidine kinase [Thermoanaerobaculales bacterium]HQN97604.1 sensor histidine kinase [Thermoanaerobaculales bacterium]HQP44082.1 sensor histidine kinase [Thermoanaerobaculales bacterium]